MAAAGMLKDWATRGGSGRSGPPAARKDAPEWFLGQTEVDLPQLVGDEAAESGTAWLPLVPHVSSQREKEVWGWVAVGSLHLLHGADRRCAALLQTFNPHHIKNICCQ